MKIHLYFQGQSNFYAVFMINTDLVQRNVINQNSNELLRRLLNGLSVMISRLLGVQHIIESQLAPISFLRVIL